MDSRGARGGETEAVDRRGQDYARYAKVTSDGKKGHKRKANVNRCHICEDIVPPRPCLPRNRSVDVSSPPAAEKVRGSQREGLYSA